MDHDELQKTMKALSDPHRIKIVEILSCGERCACEILPHFSFTQPTLSHHMKVLMECGLVEVQKKGTWSHYTLDAKTWENLVNSLGLLGSGTEDCICLEDDPEGCKK